MYAFTHFIARLYLHAWYRVEVHGERFPTEGPLLIAANHTNGLMDVALLFSSSPRPIRFLAKFSIFKTPVVGPLAKGAHAIPVYRKKDGVSMERNAQTFAAVYDALAQGEVIGVFPEGESGTSMSIRTPLKTGIARMGLGAMELHPDVPVRVLPLGLHTRERDRFRSRLELVVGEPIEIGHHLAEFREDPRAAVPKLMEEIEAAMRSVAPNLVDEEDRDEYRLAWDHWYAKDGSHHPRLRAWTERGARPERRERAKELIDRSGEAPGSKAGLLLLPVVALAAIVWLPGTLIGRVAGRAAPADKFVTVTALVAPLVGALLIAIATTIATWSWGAWSFVFGVLSAPLSWWLLGAGIWSLDRVRAALRPSPARGEIEAFLGEDA